MNQSPLTLSTDPDTLKPWIDDRLPQMAALYEQTKALVEGWPGFDTSGATALTVTWQGDVGIANAYNRITKHEPARLTLTVLATPQGCTLTATCSAPRGPGLLAVVQLLFEEAAALWPVTQQQPEQEPPEQDADAEAEVKDTVNRRRALPHDQELLELMKEKPHVRSMEQLAVQAALQGIVNAHRNPINRHNVRDAWKRMGLDWPDTA